MSSHVVPKKYTTNGNGSVANGQTRSSNPSRAEDTGGEDGRTRRKLRKGTSESPKSPHPPIQTPPPENEEQRPNFMNKRRPSLRNNKVPMGARPLGSFAMKQSSNNSTNNTSAPTTRSVSGTRPLPRSRQPSVSNASQFNFGTTSLDTADTSKPEVEAPSFLPPVNFDDLHTSLQLGDLGDFSFDKHDKPPVRHEFATGPQKDGGNAMYNGIVPASTAGEVSKRPARTSSLIRPPSKSTGIRGLEGTGSEAMGPPAKNTQSHKPRRQSHFPSSASSQSLGSGRAPRKSIGPGILSNGTTEYSLFNDGLAAKADRQKQEWLRGPRSRETSSTHAASRYSLAAPGEPNGVQNTRGSKTKSMQSPAKFNTDLLQAASRTPENIGAFPIAAQRSPGRDSYGPGTPGSSKRMSQHASGLGARTISPTDARRMKRLSQMPTAPPMPHTPPTAMPEPPPPRARSTIDSPSFIPRKSVTPSSNRTTPDHNRKSYSSVVSVSSSTSFNSLGKAPSGQTRLQQSAAASRLPTLKSRAESTTAATNEMGVPPVPAIPKAYESPKGEPESPYFAPRKSSLPFDSLSVNSNSTLEYVSAPSGTSSDKEKETPKPVREQQRRTTAADSARVAEERASGTQDGRRGLQPLQLPPLTLLPSKSQTSNVETSPSQATKPLLTPMTPPPQRAPLKTPSTPMTASRATFFGRHRGKDESAPVQVQTRSSSSHHALRSDTYPMPAHFSSSDRAVVDLPPPRKASSPFTSSSLPKTSGEFPQLRTKASIASVDRSASTVSSEARTSRLTGPRALTSTRAPKTDLTPQQQRSPSEAEGSSFGNSLRRKLSLTRRRSSSKVEGEQPPKPPSHESMPPPKLPASATLNDLPTSNSTAKTSYLHSRRKSSHPETTVRQERARSEVFAKDGASDMNNQATATQRPHASSKVSQSSLRRPGSTSSFSSARLQICDAALDNDDMKAEEEMRTLAKKRRKTEAEAKELDELRRRAVPRDRVSPAQALKAARLNIYERGEIVDYKDVYFCGTQNAKKFAGNLEAENVNFGYDDERGDYNIVVGDHLAYRYEVVDILGKGSFGQVVRCVDHKTGGLEAIKIIRNKKRFHQQALVEVNILQKIRDWDPDNRYSMVNFTQSFYFRGHLCISTELLGMNLYEFIKVHDFRGFSLKLIRRFTKQMLNCLVLLKSKKVIHCDLKPENILLAHPAKSEIKVIDFGSSCLENEKVYTYIQSRFYRSPEVILGMSYGMPIDMWSLGCILAELLTGYPIFPGENEQEQLACIMEVFGPPDKQLIEKSTRKKLFFDSLGKPRLTVSSKGKRRRPSSKTLQQAIKCDDEAFCDFLARCLRWDPERRLKPDEAIHHEFITGVKPTVTRNLRTFTPSSTNTTSSSPIKRFNSMHTPSAGVRPLPEPPATALKAAPAVRAVNGGSPSRPAPKRHSTVTALSTGVASNRKGPGPAPTTSLPKPGMSRTASGPVGAKDLASAAAAAATTKTR